MLHHGNKFIFRVRLPRTRLVCDTPESGGSFVNGRDASRAHGDEPGETAGLFVVFVGLLASTSHGQGGASDARSSRGTIGFEGVHPSGGEPKGDNDRHLCRTKQGTRGLCDATLRHALIGSWDMQLFACSAACASEAMRLARVPEALARNTKRTRT